MLANPRGNMCDLTFASVGLAALALVLSNPAVGRLFQREVDPPAAERVERAAHYPPPIPIPYEPVETAHSFPDLEGLR